MEGGEVLFERSFLGIGFWFEFVKKFVIACTDPFRGVSLIYEKFFPFSFFLLCSCACVRYVQKCDIYEKWPIFSCQKETIRNKTSAKSEQKEATRT